MKHDDSDPLCRDNLRKAAQRHEDEKVAVYWRGYLAGKKFAESQQKICMGCRQPYEHTHPWARALKLCKRCADIVMARQSRRVRP